MLVPLGGDADTRGEERSVSPYCCPRLGLCSLPEHPLEAGEVRSSQVGLWQRKLVRSVLASRSDVKGS